MQRTANMHISHVVFIVLTDFSFANDWCYFGCENSPSHWGKHYPKCNGCKQSPVNIDTQNVTKNHKFGSFDLINFTLPYTMKMLKNTGHTVECELQAGVLAVQGGGLRHKYTILQFHFHWGGRDLIHHLGSEHSIDGHRSPVEMHIVSRRSDLNDSTATVFQDGFAVLAFFMVMEDKQKEKPQIWKNFTDYLQKIPGQGNKVRIMEPFSMDQLLKGVDLTKYYRYIGSLTTPPCEEAVVWTIFKDPIRISRDLLLRFPAQISFNNVYRPQQFLNNRVVFVSAAVTADSLADHPTGHIRVLGDTGTAMIAADTQTEETQEVANVNPKLWAAHKDEAGLIDVILNRAALQTDKPVYCKKYALSAEKEEENSPSHMGKHYPKCNGCKQSPVNTDTQNITKNHKFGSFDLINFTLPYTMKMLKNTGHTVECVLQAGVLAVQGGGLRHKYNILQFHFHWGGRDLIHHPGSEHSLDGHRSPVEVRVSQRSDLNDSTATVFQDGFAVLAFFMVMEDKQKEKPQIWKNFTDYLQKIPGQGNKVRIMEPFSMDQLLKGVDLTLYYRYIGSLTTPPCEEAVVWTIFKDPIRISRDLVQISFNNVYRPQQFLNNRVVFVSAAVTADSLADHPTGHIHVLGGHNPLQKSCIYQQYKYKNYAPVIDSSVFICII
ncbi:uncharacterized protein LOC127427213 [Myxocyprinus asiaticus]|uniref:uncharacterized protein LOC127427213 n=1 Tax=Myxocyprinus asiaticus TaxID=70543 RepID=UPI002222F3D8|nr:uncharacterized protein LOC127427213 [Myxocyprinus asiaticus]